MDRNRDGQRCQNCKLKVLLSSPLQLLYTIPLNTSGLKQMFYSHPVYESMGRRVVFKPPSSIPKELVTNACWLPLCK